MTSQGIASRKPVLFCKRCGHEWKPKPGCSYDVCPSCHSTIWDRTIPGQDVVARLEKPEAVVERLMQAAAEILTTSARCSIGKGLDGRYQAIPPLTLQRWKATPELYGHVLAHLDRETTADELGTALYGPLWKRPVS